MKKNSIIAIIIVIAIILIGVAIAINSSGSNSTESADSTTQKPATAEPKYAVPDDAKTFFEDYTNLQNEASRKVDTGELTEEKYFDLLQKGIEIAQMKETYEAEGASDELNTQIAEIKPYLYDIATEIGSDLADKFKTE